MSHLLVDAMNVIGSRPDGWWRDRAGAIRRLVDALRAYTGDAGAEVDVFIDGGPIVGLDEGMQGGVGVWYARRAGPNAADDRIAEYVRDHDDPGSLEVVTSDHALGARVRDSGARVVGASWLLRELDARRDR